MTCTEVVAGEIVHVVTTFTEPLVTAAGDFRVRRSALIRLDDADGRSGWGECAPWPPNVPVADEVLRETLRRLVAGADLDENQPLPAAVRAAFTAAMCDLAAQAAGVPLHVLLGSAGVAGAAVTTGAIRVHGNLPSARGFQAGEQAGKQAVKVKVGARSPEVDMVRLQALREQVGPDVGIRLDANGAWTLKEAISALDRFAAISPEYVEQPIPAGDTLGLAALRANVSVPIVADEAVIDRSSLEALIEVNAVDGIMLKLARVGGPRQAVQLAEIAAAAGLDVYVSSNFEFAIGLAAAVHVAAVLPSTTLHGLGTAAFLERDITSLWPSGPTGRVRVPSGIGLGVVPDPHALDRVRACATEHEGASCVQR